ncbi:MAG: SAM hydrolase/SAM-dependent halogenase family protein [Terriglobales bacterium]
MRPLLVTLATDFGPDSAYTALLKGALLTRWPGAVIYDLSHSLEGGDVWGAAFFLRRVCGGFPAGSVHLVGVDRGDSDQVLVADAAGQRWIGMDNGLLSLVLAAHPRASVRAVRPAPRTTFLARDAMVELCGGEHGAPAADWRRLELPADPQVLHVDRFGNLITSLTRAQAPGALEVEGTVISAWAGEYGEGRTGELVLVWGAEGWLEISLLGGSAAERLGARRGTAVGLR